MQRQSVGLAADMPRNHADGTKLAHRPGVGEDHAIEQPPLDVGQGDIPEGLPAIGAQHHRRFLFFLALRLHQRDQLAGNEGKGDEHGGQHDAGHGEDDLDVVVEQPRPQPALGPENQHKDQTGDHRRHRKRQIDQGDQEVLATKFELGNRPGCRHPEHQVERYRNQRCQQGQPDRRQGIRIGQGRQIGFPPLAEGFDKDCQQRQQQENGEESQRDADDRPFDQRRFTRRRLALETGGMVAAHMQCHSASHQRSLPVRLAVQACKPLMISSRTKEKTSMTDAIAVAPT